MSDNPLSKFEALQALAQPGDCILVNHLNPLMVVSDAIKWFENGTVCHAATYVGDGKIVEAEALGIRLAFLSEYFAKDQQLVLRRPSVSDPGAIAIAALRQIGTGYGFTEDLVDGLYLGAGKLRALRLQAWIGKKIHASRRTMNCSQSYATAVWVSNNVLLVPEKNLPLVTPQDLLKSSLLETIATA